MKKETCPRCGAVCIEVKDWGKGGKLFVHGRTVENGIPVQDAHHVWAEELENGLRWTVTK